MVLPLVLWMWLGCVGWLRTGPAAVGTAGPQGVADRRAIAAGLAAATGGSSEGGRRRPPRARDALCLCAGGRPARDRRADRRDEPQRSRCDRLYCRLRSEAVSKRGVKLQFKAQPHASTRSPVPLRGLAPASSTGLKFEKCFQRPPELAHFCHHRFIGNRVSTMPISPIPVSFRRPRRSAPMHPASTVFHARTATRQTGPAPGARTATIIGNLKTSRPSGCGRLGASFHLHDPCPMPHGPGRQ